MSASKLAQIAVIACVTGALAVASATSAAFTGNACRLLTASQPSAVHVTAKCVEQKTVTNSLGTISGGAWGKIPGGDPYLGITITKPPVGQYALGLAMAKGRAHGRALGIGTWSSESGLTNGGTFDSVSFAQHGYLVLIEVNAKSRPLSSARVVALARRVAAGI